MPEQRRQVKNRHFEGPCGIGAASYRPLDFTNGPVGLVTKNHISFLSLKVSLVVALILELLQRQMTSH